MDGSGKRLDQQDIIMAELEIRVKQNQNVSIADKIDTPIAVMIGKCDILKDQLDWERILWPVKDKKLDLEIVEKNSEILREYMMDMHLSIVANSEALSRNVRYFPVSPFGHSPGKVELDGQKYIAPDPDKLDPVMVEVPTLWMLHHVESELIPTSAAG